MKRLCFVLAIALSAPAASEPLRLSPSGGDDTALIQATIDDLNLNGGGELRLSAGLFSISGTVHLKSGVSLTGAGRGTTILRALGGSWASVPVPGSDSLEAAAVIATLGDHHIQVSSLTIDTHTNRAACNGVALMPIGQDFQGTPTRYAAIRDVEVLGNGLDHRYMIWSFRGEHIKIQENFINAYATEYSESEGIEIAGGHDVLVQGNTVENVGNACIYLNTAGTTAQTLKKGVRVAQNYVSHCENGIRAIAGSDETMGIDHLLVSDNQVHDVRHNGIDIKTVPGSFVRGLGIVGNQVLGAIDHGIFFDGDGVEVAESLRITDNQITGGDIGIRIDETTRDSAISNNTITGTRSAIWISRSSDVSLRNNHIGDVGERAIGVVYSDSVSTRGNYIRDWNLSGIGRPAVWFFGSTGGSVIGNDFKRPAGNQGAPLILVDPNSDGVVVRGNHAF